MTYHKLTDKKVIMNLFTLCWMAYFTCYIGRLNYSSAMTAMIEGNIFLKSEAGFISMVYFFAYGSGQLINGFLGDKRNPGKMIFLGLMLSMVCNLSMGLITAFGGMAVIWGINGYAQSMIWPPVIRIFAQMLEEETRLRCCINIVSTQAIGTLVSYLLSAAVLAFFDWRMVFFTAAGCLLVAALIWITGFRKVETYSLTHMSADEKAADDRKLAGAAGGKAPQTVSLSKLIISGGLLIIVIPVVVHGILKDGVTSWVPTYILETFHTSPSLSILVTTVLPIVNLSGAYAARYLYVKMKEQEAKAASVFFLLSVLCLILLWKFGSYSMLLTVVLLALITSSMMAVNTLFVNLLPLRFEKLGRVSTVSGFLNAMAYAGTAVSTFTIGIMVQKWGWETAIFSWVAVTAAGLLGCAAAGKRFQEK